MRWRGLTTSMTLEKVLGALLRLRRRIRSPESACHGPGFRWLRRLCCTRSAGRAGPPVGCWSPTDHRGGPGFDVGDDPPVPPRNNLWPVVPPTRSGPPVLATSAQREADILASWDSPGVRTGSLPVHRGVPVAANQGDLNVAATVAAFVACSPRFLARLGPRFLDAADEIDHPGLAFLSWITSALSLFDDRGGRSARRRERVGSGCGECLRVEGWLSHSVSDRFPPARTGRG